MKHPVRLIAVAAAAALALTACAGGGGGGGDSTTTGGSGGGGDVTLNMLAATYSDNTKTLWEGYIKDFQDANPGVKINLEMQSWENINDVIKTKVQSGQAPDILSIDAFADYARDDLLYSADELLSAETIADFEPSFVENASMDGKQYGFPLIASARALFVNNKLMTEAGAKVPTTWQELYDAAKLITDKTGKYGYGMPLGNEEAQAETGIWIFSGGGTYGDVEKLTIDTPTNLEAVTFMKKMIDGKVTQPDAGSTQRTPMLDVFIQGEMGMAVGLPPILGMIKEKNPELDYSIVPFPTKDGTDKTTLGVADHLMAFKNDASKKEMTGKFLDFFFSTDNYVKFIDTEGFLPTTKSGAEKTTLTDFGPFLEVLPYAKFYPSTNPNWGVAQGSVKTNIGLIASGEDPAKVLKDIQAEADAG